MGLKKNKAEDKSTKKSEKSQEEIIKQRKEKTAQQWMPISDIEESRVYRKDNHVIAMIRVQPENIELLSDREKKRRISSLTEEWNGINKEMQIFCVGRPVDLNDYLESLQEKAKMEQDFTRKSVLKGYIQHTTKLVTSGEIIERRFYIILNEPLTNSKAEEDIIKNIEELKDKFNNAELSAEVCYTDEIMDVYALFASPMHAAFEKTEFEFDLPALLV